MATNDMLVKHEIKSARVKGVAFHAKRPWVLCGVHDGGVEIIDTRTGTLVERFEEHEGPVRAVAFHVSQPLFCSGGDDYKVRVWNFKARRCLYALQGHLDFVRTVQFHHEQPWIVSASDDQTLRIWNWQSRSCLSILTGHNHYVMCAQFHPKDDLIVSASLDVTIRVWDISGLRSRRSNSNADSLPHELFGNNDVALKFVLEGHEKGVNWASFHPTKPFIVSGADDRTIRIWRMDNERTFEIDQLRGHTNFVSSVMYYKDMIVSVSEDRTIRVWDPALRNPIQVFRKDNERFWHIAAHPTQNLLAAGHDAGTMVFKLERERPVFHIQPASKMLYWIKERAVKSYNLATDQQQHLMTLRRHNGPPSSLSMNPSDQAAVMWYPNDGGYFELLTFPKSASVSSESDIKKGYYTSAVFFGPNKFAVLDKTRQIVIRTSNGNEIAKVLPAVADADRLYPGPQGFVLCRGPSAVYLYDVAQKTVVAELAAPEVRHVAWDASFSKVALLSKTKITIATRKLKAIHVIAETNRVKSAVFDDERPLLYFATRSHLKYCSLISGEVGTVRSLENPIYLVHAVNNNVLFIDRAGEIKKHYLDSSELDFKAALQQERFRDVLKLIQERRVHGQCLVSYLHKSGHPDIAMHFVSDKKVKFNLALECGNIEDAKKFAVELNDPDCWRRLAAVATKFGDMQVALLANAKTQNWGGMGMGCVLTGNFDALAQVIKKSKDPSFTLHYGAMAPSGHPTERIDVLRSVGQLPLAYSVAVSHGLTEVAEQLLSEMKPDVTERAKRLSIRPAIARPVPEPENDNWPMLPIQESLFTRLLRDPSAFAQAEPTATQAKGAWGDEDDDLFGDGAANAGGGDDEYGAASGRDNGEAGAAGGGQWEEDDLDFGDAPAPVDSGAAAAGPSGKGAFVVPREGDPLGKHWVDSTNVAAYHAAAGMFQSAFQLLERQIGLVDAAPLQPYAISLWTSSTAVMPSMSLLPSHIFQLAGPPGANVMDARCKHIPSVPPVLPQIAERVQQGFKAFTEGRFADALRLFQSVLHQMVFVVCTSQQEVNEARELIIQAREYAGALNVEIQRKEGGAEGGRAVELAVYFTHFNLRMDHVLLTLGQAMTQAFKLKNFKTAASIARRILDLNPPQDRAEKARQVIQRSDGSEAVKLDYDDRNPFVLCSVSKKPMYRGTVEVIRCSYCAAAALPTHRGAPCPVCKLGRLGHTASGLVLMHN